jgi:hypothetical protein
MRRERAFSTVNWRRYLDIKSNPRAESFLEQRGDDVLWQIASNIHKGCVHKKQKEIVLLIHPNAGAVIRIPQSEYLELLQLCLSWFEVREQYKKCSEIQRFIKNVKKIKKPTKNIKKVKETLI